MKVLCKKSLTLNDRRKLIHFPNSDKKIDEPLFEENKVYPFKNENGLIWIFKDGEKHLFFDERWKYYPYLQYSIYFYTHEETINALRTKLIDEILK